MIKKLFSMIKQSPVYISESSRMYFYPMAFAFCFACAANGLYALSFFVLGYPIVALSAFTACIIFAVFTHKLYNYKKEGWYKLYYYAVAIESILLMIFYIYLGWDSGFQFYLLPTYVLTFCMPPKGKKNIYGEKILLIAIGTLLFCLLNLGAEFMMPKYNVDAVTLQILYAVNILGGWFALFIIVGYFIAFAHKTFGQLEEQRELAWSADRAKSAFLANMSHEIRTPMNAITGLSELVLREDINETVAKHAEVIKSASSLLLSIINDILDFSKIESGKMDIVDIPYSLPSIINDISNITTVKIGTKPIEFLLEADASIPSLLIGDEIRLRQILVNLLNNAAKFTNEGYVKLKLWFEPCDVKGSLWLCGSISDSGIGIKEEELDTLFNNFTRLDTTKNRSVEGTGLGLSITKRLLALMDGDITVESEYGVGSTFSFRLIQRIGDAEPMAHVKQKGLMSVVLNNSYYQKIALDYAFKNLNVECMIFDSEEHFLSEMSSHKFTHIFIENEAYQRLQPQIRQNSPDSKIVIILERNENLTLDKNEWALHKPVYSLAIASALNNEAQSRYYFKNREGVTHSFTAENVSVLLVDDNSVNLMVAEGLLRPYKTVTVTATSGMMCLEMLSHRHFDLIFMDHMMPDMDGVETVRRIRAMEGEYFKTVPIIALTANAIGGVKEMFFREGFNGFLAKPIEINKLDKILLEFLQGKIVEKSQSLQEETPAQQPASGDIDINGVDMAAAVRNCGSQQAFFALISTVYKEGVKKLRCIEDYYKNRDLENYRIEVHALKSVAATIGAKKLSELSRIHEQAVIDGNINIVDESFPELTDMYRTLLDDIKKYTDEPTVDCEDKPDIDDEKLRSGLADLYEHISFFQDKQALSLCGELLKHNLSDVVLEQLEKIKDALLLFDYDMAEKELQVIFDKK